MAFVIRKDEKYVVILLGLLVHVLLLLAIFDVYFASPLDSGMTPIRSTDSPAAKRLVLFVADGLRAQALFGKENEDRAPFLTGILKHNGSWGVSHTRMPTESRPGHVALLAGIYEDPSAVFKGWKSNPVYFDSIINQSTNAWCWGSPDVVSLFNRDSLPNIHLFSYHGVMEDFGKKRTEQLDHWVFDEVERFLSQVPTCSVHCHKYHTDGNVYFLHLLGIDTAGHGYKPHSNEYINNIRVVDEGIRETYQRFESTFKDNSTAYVFTADHGMTDWGAHGAGSDHETQVPIIAWGAGVRTDSTQNDVNQIDLAPLMASLIGINIPVNSLGVVPVDYLGTGSEDLAKVILSNALQLLEMFNVKRLRIKNHAPLYLPYKNLDDREITSKVAFLRQMLKTGHYYQLIEDCEEFMKVIKAGIEYYHNYYQYPILFSVSVGFLAWIAYLGVTFVKINAPGITNHRKNNDSILLCVIITLVIVVCYRSKLNATYYLYFAFPFVMIFLLRKKLRECDRFMGVILKRTLASPLTVIFYLLGVELMVYGFFNRTGFTILMLLSTLWVLVPGSLYATTSKTEKAMWIVMCVVLSLFPCLPVMKTSFSVPMYIAGYVGCTVAFVGLNLQHHRVYGSLPDFSFHVKCFLLQFSCLTLAATYVLLLEFEYIGNDSVWKYLSWLLFLIPLAVIPFTTEYVAIRLIATFFGFAPFYLLVSSNFEVLFSLCYVTALSTWLLVETKSFSCTHQKIIYYFKFQNYDSKNSINGDVFRRAFLFVVFIALGFFGTGNVASMNSFDPMWVRAFLTVFKPFKMAGLIVLKLIVPFIFTCCVFRAINTVGRENVLSIFCIVLAFTDLMVLQFTYLITNVGSWLDIGTSLSHFIITETFVIALLLLYAVAHCLTTIRFAR